MKYHSVLINGVCQILEDTFFGDRYADKAIEFHFKKNRKWGRRDRSFVAETAYDCVRWWSQYWALLDRSPAMDHIGELLEVSFWRRNLPFYSPVYVKNAEALSKKWSGRMGQLPKHKKGAIPQWLYEKGVAELGEDQWPLVLQALNQPNSVVLRVTGGFSRCSEAQKALQDEGVETRLLNHVPGALVLVERKNVFATKAFKDGLFEVQDGSSQLVAPYLKVEPGEFIIDACAGAGGKALHLSDLLKGKGRVLALDIHKWKLDALQKRARRQKSQNIETRCITNRKVIKRLNSKADGVLLDVPCTGMGVLRRNPDTKWKLTKERAQELTQIQSEILGDYSSMVRPGGRLVYSTCSIFPSENENIVNQFLMENPNWELESQKKIFPIENGFDGFYMARLIKTGP